MINEILLGGLMLISPVSAKEPIPIFDEPSTECLALNMYHEARGQGTAGLLAVSSVVMNRVKDERFPNTICEVIKQAQTKPSWKDKTKMIPIRDKCQFSWFCDGKSDDPKNIKQYQRMLNFSLTMLSNSYILVDITDGALFYHADYVKPSWAKTKHRTTEIGDHIFYTWDKR